MQYGEENMCTYFRQAATVVQWVRAFAAQANFGCSNQSSDRSKSLNW